MNTSVQHIKIPQVSDIPVVAPRQILPMTQTVQKTTEIPQLQFPDQVVDVPLAFVVLVPQMQVVPETVEISQLDVVEKSASTAPVRQMAQSEVVEAIEIGVKTIDLECVKVHPAGLVKPDDPDTQIKFLAAETLHGIHGNRFAKEFRRKDCALNRAASDEIARHCKHCTERGVMKLHESGTALAEGMGVPVSKMEELIAAHCQTFLKTVKDPDREPYPAYPSSKSWYKAEARQRSSEPEITVTGSVLSGKIVEVSGVTSHTAPGNTKFPLFRPCRKRWKSHRFNSLTKWMMSPSRRNDRCQRSRRYRTRKSIP